MIKLKGWRNEIKGSPQDNKLMLAKCHYFLNKQYNHNASKITVPHNLIYRACDLIKISQLKFFWYEEY